MTRISKQEKRRKMYPRKRKINLSKKTGPKKDDLEMGFRVHVNALNSNPKENVFIAKISGR